MKYLVVCIFFLFSGILQAQEEGFVRYGQDQGLSARTCYRISQDKDGFIWIGTDNGLFRFDGAEFKQYNQKDGLKNLDVLFPVALPDGSVFIAPFQNDFAIYKNGKIVNADQDPELKKLNGDHIRRMLFLIDETKQEICFVADQDPQYLYLFKHGKVSMIPLKIDYTRFQGKLSTLNYDFKGNISFCEKHKLIKYSIKDKKITILQEDFCRIKISGFSKIGENYLIFEKNELHISGARGVIKKLLFDKEIYWTQVSGNNYLWVSFLNGGIACFDLKKDPELRSPVNLLGDYFINDAFVDRESNVWFSDKNGGLFFLSKACFQSYLHSPVANSNLFVSTVAGNSGTLLIGCYDGEAVLIRNGTVTHFPLAGQKRMGYLNSAMNKRFALLADNSNTYQIDLNTWKPVKIETGITSSVKNIIPYTRNRFLLCTNKGTILYDPYTFSYRCLEAQKSYSALLLSEEELFIGSFKDLYTFNIKTKRKKIFLKGYYFTDLKKWKNNLYLGSTNGNGLIVFNKERILKKITVHDGLATNQIRRIAVENETTCWAITDMGLSRISLKGPVPVVRNFSKADGLPSDLVSGSVLNKDSIYIGTAQGMAFLKVKELLRQKKYLSTKVIIQFVRIGKREITEFSRPVVTPYSKNNITIKLSFPDYLSNGKISYRYKIENLSREWQTSTSSNINLTAIPPGVYFFKVYAMGYNGKRSAYVTVLRFEVRPEFWQTLWFQILAAFLLACVVFLIGNYLFHRKKNKRLLTLEFEKKIAELELQAIKAQMNPHFVYNCLNSIQYLLYKKDYGETQNYLDVFTKMIRKTLHYSEKTFTTIGEEVTYMQLYLEMEKMRFSGNFTYSIDYTEAVNLNWKIPSLLIQPFAENALKHGFVSPDQSERRIEISFDSSGYELVICIRDNGVGFGDESMLSKDHSFGIRLSQKRIDTFRKLFRMPIRLEAGNHPEGGAEIKLYLLIDENESRDHR